MARGGIAGAAEDIQKRRAGGGAGGSKFFRLRKAGDSAVVRFLEQGDEITWAWVHQLPPVGDQKWGDSIPCRDQDEAGQRTGDHCPLCAKDEPRKFKGVINLIQRDAPKFKTNSEGRIEEDAAGNWITDGAEDVVKIWEQGIKVFEELDGKDATYKGLKSRDFRITRKGTGLDTTYVIEPADVDGGPQPMSDADKQLEGTKYDLTPYVTPKPIEAYTPGAAAQPAEEQAAAAEAASPFTRTRA